MDPTGSAQRLAGRLVSNKKNYELFENCKLMTWCSYTSHKKYIGDVVVSVRDLCSDDWVSSLENEIGIFIHRLSTYSVKLRTFSFFLYFFRPIRSQKVLLILNFLETLLFKNSPRNLYLFLRCGASDIVRKS